jgi:CRISPR-associated protein Cas1
MDCSLENDYKASCRGAKTGNGYPEHSATDGNIRCLIKDDASEREESKALPTMVIEDAGEKEEKEEGDGKDSLVEDGDRLYVLTHGSYLTVDGNDLLIKKRKAEFHRRPLDQLGLLYLQGFGMNISVSLQLRLAELDIPVVFAPPVGEPLAVLNPISSTRSFLRGLQVLRRDDPDVVTAGLKMLASKIINQAAVLRYFTKYRKKTNPEFGRQMTAAAESIRGLAERVLTLDPAAATVRTEAMGYEGHAASLYWQHVIKMLPKDFGFMGRTTRAAKDLVNQCLNYTYGILYGEVWRAVVKAGLDPYFGLMHGSKRDQGSLVFDLIEEFRAPFADRLVIGMLGRGFMPELGNHGFLKTRTRRQLALRFSKRWMKKIEWRSHSIEPGAILTKQAGSIVKLMNREGEYHPFRMRW